VFCLNPNHYESSLEKQLSDFIINNKIDVVCTGGMSVHYNEINDVLRVSKNIKPDIITIVGGAIVTSNPKVTCWGIKNLDYGVVGEGEETIVELAHALVNKTDIEIIKGLSYFKNLGYHLTPERVPIKNLDKIPMPDYEGFEYDEYIKLFYPSENHFFSIMDNVRAGYIMASRSCPFACTFCYHHPSSKYRQRSLDNIFFEIEYLIYKYDINFLNITDELFSFDKKRMYEFASRIKKYNLKWWTNFRVSDVDKEVLEILKNSGMFMISYGIESMSDKILKSMKKHITKSQIEEALRLTYEAKINIQGNIILGDPEETEETIKESIDWLKNHPEYGINLVMIRTYPFSPIYKYALSKGLIKDEFEHMVNKFPLINLTKMSDKKYKEISIYVENFGEETKNLLGGNVIAKPLKISDETLYSLEDNLLLFFTGYSRSASSILKEQDDKSKQNDIFITENLNYVKKLGLENQILLEKGNLVEFAELMNEHWEFKKVRSGYITNLKIDQWYDIAMENGAIGGKLIGAGGGGFLMFYTNDNQKLRHAMAHEGLKEVRFKFDFEGTKIIT